jgi:hypothetical protein
MTPSFFSGKTANPAGLSPGLPFLAPATIAAAPK